MLAKVTLKLLIIKSIYCENSVSDKFLKNIYSKSTECIKTIVRNNFPCGYLITLVDSKKDGELMQSLNSDNDCYSFIIRSFEDNDWFIPAPMYVVRAKNVTEFAEGFLTITNDLFWNPRGRIVVELETLEEEKRDTVFHILMQHRAYDAILIRKSNTDFVIDTYYPFKDNNCGKKLEMATIGDCKNVAHFKWLLNEEISLRNCTVKVAAAQDVPIFIFESSDYTENGKSLRGSEQLLLETIAEKEGFQLSYMLLDQTQRFGVVLPNHTATGLLAILQSSDVDIAAGGFILIRNRILLFDYVWGYNYAAFKLFTPAIGEEIWKDVYREFTGETWLLIVIAYCLVAVISTMRLRLLLRKSQHQMCLALKLWGYLYINTSSKLCNDKRFRMIMVFWLWFTFFICNFYNTELYSLLTRRNQIQRHISVDRLHELPYEPCISVTTRTYYLFAFRQKLPEDEGIPECEFTDTALDYVATEKKAYAIELDYIYELNKYKYMDEDGVPILDTWTFSINNAIAIYLARGFPLIEKFQHHAWKMYETGLLKNNLDKINRLKNHPEPTLDIDFEKIGLSDLRIHFSILMLGYLLSMLCVVLEMLWYRYSRTTKVR